MRSESGRRGAWTLAACLLVSAATVATFSPVLRNGFVNWDDPYLIVDNPHIRSLAWPQIRWMFTTLYMNTYQPLGWLAYALVYLAQGGNAFGFHAASLFLHALNAALLCLLVLRLLGRADGRRLVAAATAAMAWALHPLQVESVAWATELPDLLSTTLFLAAILTYLVYARRGGTLPLAACWGLYAASGLARWKSLSLPVVLVVLDAYPLRRLTGQSWRWLERPCRRLWLEKLPFLATAAGVALVNASSKRLWGQLQALASPEEASLKVFFYLRKLVWPAGLLPSYTLAAASPGGTWGLSACAVVAATACLFALRRKWPACLAAWVCYLAAIAPTAAFTQQGPLLAFDHYAYLSTLSFVPVFAGAGLALRDRLGSWRPAAAALGVLLLAGLALTSRRQAGLWRDSITLWTHTLAVDPGSRVAHTNLGVALLEEDRLEEAAAQFKRALELDPGDRLARHDLEQVLSRLARRPPEGALGEARLGAALCESGKTSEGIVHLKKALELAPELEEARNNLGLALYRQGRVLEAVRQFRECLRINPGFAEAHNNLGIALVRLGRLDEAILEFRRTLRIDKNHARAQDDLRMALELKRASSPTTK